MFRCLKSNGFDLEGISLTNPAKVRLMLCVVIACYVLCVCEGIRHIRKIAVRKRPGPATSLFFAGGTADSVSSARTLDFS